MVQKQLDDESEACVLDVEGMRGNVEQHHQQPSLDQVDYNYHSVCLSLSHDAE